MWTKAIHSSCQRSARVVRKNMNKSLKEYGESLYLRVSILGWDDKNFLPYFSARGPSVASSTTSKSSGCDRMGQLTSALGHRQIAGFFDRFPEVEILRDRVFMSRAGYHKEAEEIEGSEAHESEDEQDFANDNEFEESDIFEEEFGAAAAPVEQEQEKLTAAKEILWRRISRVKLASPEEVMAVIHKWREQNKELTKGFLIAYITRLRKRARYKHALEISNWLAEEKPFDLDPLDYGFRIDLTARVGQMDKAEKLFTELPSEYKNSLAYSTLLMNYVKHGTLGKAEDLFKEMKKLGLLTSPFAVNQMLRLYQSKGTKEKVPLLLDEAKLLGIEHDIFSYNILMDIEGKAGNIEAMEKILEEVKANSKVRLDAKSHGIIASAYISANMLDKAELALKRMETGDYPQSPAMYNALLKLYGKLKSAEEVERIWRILKSLPRKSDYSVTCLLTAFASLDSPKGAEEAFKDMEQMIRANEPSTSTSTSTFSSRRLKLLYKLCKKFGFIEKAEEVKKEMPKNYVSLDVVHLHTSVEGYLKSDDLEKAYEALNLNKEGSRIRPLFDTFILILEKYAEKGDVKASEKIFEACRKARYTKETKLWNTLLKAYLRANLPAYGFRQRMYADRVYPNSETQKLLNDLKQHALQQ